MTEQPEVLRQSLSLLQFLSGVAREVGPRQVTDARQHPLALWPADLPDSHPALHVNRTGAGSTVLTVDRVPAPHPLDVPEELRPVLGEDTVENPQREPKLDTSRVDEVVTEMAARRFRVSPQTPDPERDEWIETEKRRLADEVAQWKREKWTPWAEEALPDFLLRDLHHKLFQLHVDSSSESDTFEIIWGELVLSYRDNDATVVAPLVTTPVTIQLDSTTAAIRVVVERTPEVELDALEGSRLPGVELLSSIQSEFHSNPVDLSSLEDRHALRNKLITQMGTDASLIDNTNVPSPSSSPQLNDGWVLLKRRRPLRQERFYDDLSQKLSDDSFIPEAFASTVADNDTVNDALRELGQQPAPDDGTAERLMMPLPANEEQERIARQLSSSRGVTVLGPPGTGKSHTIVNLLSHLVSQGKRVLVTAEKEQALSVLRDKIPASLQDLSVAVLGSTPAALEEMRSSVETTQDVLAALDDDAVAKDISDGERVIDQLRHELGQLDGQLSRALSDEAATYDLPTGVARAPEVATWLAEHRFLDVVPDDLPEEAEFPLSQQEFDVLVENLRSYTPADAEASLDDLPTDEWVWDGDSLRNALTRLDDLRSRVGALDDSGLRPEALDSMTPDEVHDLSARAREAADIIESLSGPWETAFGAALRAQDPSALAIVTQNSAVIDGLRHAQELADDTAGAQVFVPDGDPALQIPLLQQWAERLHAGKKISMFAARELKDLSSAVTVNGHSPSTASQVHMAVAEVRRRSLLQEAHTRLMQAHGRMGIPVPPLDPVTFQYSAQSLVHRVDTIRRWWAEDHPQLVQGLVRAFPRAAESADPLRMRELADVLGQARIRFEEREVTQSLAALTQKLHDQTESSHPSPLWREALSHLEAGDASGWDTTLTEAARLRRIRTMHRSAEDLLGRISVTAPQWAAQIRESRAATTVVESHEQATDSWAYAQARTWLKGLHAAVDVESLMQRSHDVSERLTQTITETATASARFRLKESLRDSQRRALDTWLTAVKKVGKGTGKNAPRYQAAAREALPQAMGAMPVWIMPIHKVLDNFDPRVSSMFDVVIVDESSQCDLLTLGVLALGRKSVIVGDDKQTSPNRVGTKVERIAELQEQYVSDIPGAKLLTLDDSLYSLATRAFSSTISLREHFRCVPEIIEFSSKRYYAGGIRPLREIAQPQLGSTLNAVHVSDSVSEKVGSNRVNLTEAEAIADQVAACAEDPAYADLTFGVVSIMSGPQSDHIQEKIRERIGEEEFESRQLRVGHPPDFQGDERNVVFISMVAHDSSYAMTSPNHAQWVNVAASRAQDQLWVFYSMDPQTLNHNDERRALIEYVQHAGAGNHEVGLFEKTDSMFERDVLRQILDRGYTVEPQYRVGNYRIDFVITVGDGYRLAVECDGDSFHGPDKWDDDVRRQRVLERLGWQFWRIRASQYYYSPETALRPLWERLDSMRAELDAIAHDRMLEDRVLGTASQDAGSRETV